MINSRKFRVAAILVFLALVIACAMFFYDDTYEVGTYTVHFVDVGQGDCILIQSPQANVLIDGGPRSKSDDVIRYLRNHGIKSLDAIIATNPHEDHVGGLIKVLENFPVQTVYIPDTANTNKVFTDFVQAVKNSGANRIEAKAGVTVDIADITGEFLGPADSFGDDLDNNSAVFKLTYGSTVFLFTSDIKAEAEADLVKNGSLQADVLKVSNHGSSDSTTDEFLAAVKPDYAVIFCGEDNLYDYPHAETLLKLIESGADIYRTDEAGTIVFVSDGEKVEIAQGTWLYRDAGWQMVYDR